MFAIMFTLLLRHNTNQDYWTRQQEALHLIMSIIKTKAKFRCSLAKYALHISYFCFVTHFACLVLCCPSVSDNVAILLKEELYKLNAIDKIPARCGNVSY